MTTTRTLIATTATLGFAAAVGLAPAAQGAVLVAYDFNDDPGAPADPTDGQAVPFTADRTTATTGDDPTGGTLASFATEFTRASSGTSGNFENESTAGGGAAATPSNLQIKGSSGQTTPSGAVNVSGYFEFTVRFSDLPTGQTADLDSLDFITAKSGSGDRGFFITTNGPSDGGYDAPTDAEYAAPSGNTTPATFVNFDRDVSQVRNTGNGSTNEFLRYSLDLTGPAFQGLTSDLTFRLYTTSVGQGSTIQFDDFQLLGDVVVPEPASFALLGLGGLMLLPRRKH